MSTPQPHPAEILIVDDEEGIRRFLRATLLAHGYRVREAASARDAIIQTGVGPPDLVLLDLGLPDGDGLDVLRAVRGWSRVPVVVLSARGQESDKVAALDSGADDYLTKPFGVGELLARVRVALRHGATPSDPAAEVAMYVASREGARLEVDLVRRSVAVGGAEGLREVKLTPTEFKLLACLVRHAGRILTHQQLLRDAWGPTHEADVQYLRVYAAQLRRKLELDPAMPRFLLTELGVGYRMAEPDPRRL